jgi:hypothetical protein
MSLNLIQNIAAAESSAVVTVTFIHPINVIKTWLQISGDGTRNYKTLHSLELRLVIDFLWLLQ